MSSLVEATHYHQEMEAVRRYQDDLAARLSQAEAIVRERDDLAA